MDILYSYDMRSITVYAVRTGRRIRFVASASRNPPEDWEIDALKEKGRKQPIEGLSWWWQYLGVAPENAVSCVLREPVGGDPKGRYTFEKLRLVVRGPDQILVMPCPTNDKEWSECLLRVYSAILDAAIYREGRYAAIKKANARWQKRVTLRKKRRAEAEKKGLKKSKKSTKKIR